MKKLTLFSIVALFTLLPIFSANASIEAVLLDEVIKREFGEPDYETFSFVASEGKATIRIFNGNKHKKRKNVIAAKILLNGEKITSRRNFNWKVSYKEIDVDLVEGENTLSVLARGYPKSKLQIQVIQLIEPEVIAEIGSEGGFVEVDDPESSISGAAIEIPPESIPDEVEIVEIEITAVAIPAPLPEADFQAGNTVNIESNVEVFDEPVLLSIPYNDENDDGVLDGTTISEIRVGVKYFNGTSWEEVPVIDRDFEINIVTIETTHFSNYVAYANGEIPAYDETQVVSNGTIIIDGEGSDWDSLIPGPVDPEGDNTKGDSTWDIKHVYTALDSQYAYLMIETYGEIIPEDATIDFNINYKSGEVFPWIPYADIGGSSSHWGSGFFSYTQGVDIQGYEVGRGSVLEFKIPLSELENTSYFNVIVAKIWKDNYADVYDKFSFGPYMDYWIAERHYYDGAAHSRLQFEFYDENNNFVFWDIQPSSVVLTNIDDQTVHDITSDYTWEPWSLLFGRWIEFPPTWHFDNTFSEGGGYYIDIDTLVAGNYRLSVVDQYENQYERDFYFKGSGGLPEVYPNIDDGNLFFDSDGNLHAYWNSPFSEDYRAHVKFYPYQDDGGPDFTAIFVGTPLDRGYAMVPAIELQKLYDKGGPYSVGYQIRSGDRSNRWYAENVDMNDIPTSTPVKWQQPIMEDWNTPGGFDPVKWFPYSYNPNFNIIPDTITNSVSVETTVGETGELLYVSKYDLEGDFDIEIDFQITDWPVNAEKGDVELCFQIGFNNDQSGVSIGVTPSGGFLSDGTPTNAPRVYFSNWGGEAATNDTSGRFRIEKNGLLVKTYFRDNQNDVWVHLDTIYDIGPQPVAMGIRNWGWGENPGLPAAGTFSNFRRIK